MAQYKIEQNNHGSFQIYRKKAKERKFWPMYGAWQTEQQAKDAVVRYTRQDNENFARKLLATAGVV